MATVTIGKPYFEALLRRAEFHTAKQSPDFCDDLSNNVTISKVEHGFLLQAVQEYNMLKSALFRGGLTLETLETLLEGENRTMDQPPQYDYWSEDNLGKSNMTAVAIGLPPNNETSPTSDNTAVCHGLQPGAQPCAFHRILSYGEPESSFDSLTKDDGDHGQTRAPAIPVHAQRTLLITNLSDRTTHKDIAGIIRGGRLLDIFLRNDRTATVSFIEGAAEFLTYAKRNDIYLHMKRLDIRWSDRQFHVPPHVSNKIIGGATRNLVVRGIAGKIDADQIRDHLDHIHNLVAVDIYFKDGDAFISTNSIHNALYARTCMMSRTAYKGARIEFYPDECASPLPQPTLKAYTPAPRVSTKPAPFSNPYAVLGIDSDYGSDSEEEPSLINGIEINGHG